MLSSSPGLAEVFRQGFDDYASTSGPLPHTHYEVADAIRNCRTEALGGRLYRCDHCHGCVPLFNSCRNRHCPQCQAMARARWVDKRLKELLPVVYFHIVFTIPSQLKPFALRNKEAFYNLMFKAVSATLTELAANPRWLGGTIGFIAVLHTWTQTLMDHPHIHCVVPAGALDPDGVEWIHSQRDFLFPVEVVKTLYRGKFLALFRDAVARDEIVFHGCLENERAGFAQLVDTLYRTKWVVYMKPSFASPTAVIKYLGAYTNRIAISDSRIKSVGNGGVTFSYEDRRNGGAQRLLALPLRCFLQRFLFHVLPKGFVRIRYYGFMANRDRNDKIEQCRAALEGAEEIETFVEPHSESPEAPQDVRPKGLCPLCQKGTLVLIEEIPKRAGPPWRLAA